MNKFIEVTIKTTFHYGGSTPDNTRYDRAFYNVDSIFGVYEEKDGTCYLERDDGETIILSDKYEEVKQKILSLK